MMIDVTGKKHDYHINFVFSFDDGQEETICNVSLIKKGSPVA